MLSYLGQGVLLLRGERDIAEEQSTVLSAAWSLATQSAVEADSTHLVEQVMNLLELLRAERTWIDSLDLPPEVLELRSVRGRRYGKWGDLNGHDSDSSVEVLSRITEGLQLRWADERKCAASR